MKLYSEFKVKPTLRCACNNEYRERQVEYTTPPEGEILKPGGTGTEYWRAYDVCRLCSHYFEVHDFDITSLYEGDYVKTTYGSLERIHETFRRIIDLPPSQSDNAGRVNRINKKITEYYNLEDKDFSSLSLLDVGSGLGVFPYVMQACGWQATALDPDPTACKHMSDKLKLQVICADYLKIDHLTIGKYNLITFNKVLEHVEDPVDFLFKSKSVLNSGGMIYIEVPDIEAMNDHQNKDREEFHLGHLHVFSPASLYKLIETAGLSFIEMIRLRDPSGKYTLTVFCKTTY